MDVTTSRGLSPGIDIPKNDNLRRDGVEYFDGDEDRFPTADGRTNCSTKYSATQQIGFVTFGQNEKSFRLNTW
jgi:hypothetical protein